MVQIEKDTNVNGSLTYPVKKTENLTDEEWQEAEDAWEIEEENEEVALMADADDNDDEHYHHLHTNDDFHYHDDWDDDWETIPESHCSGLKQSPININTEEVLIMPQGTDPFVIHPNGSTILKKVWHNGHGIQFEIENGDSMEFMGKKYKIHQFHFHGSSEHTLNKWIFPAEAHMVFNGEEPGEYIVIGVFIKEGEPDHRFEFIFDHLPEERGDEVIINEEVFIDSLFIPTDEGFFSYRGSLTTPPCTEDVLWIVLKEPIYMSAIELEHLQRAMPYHNFRPVQDLNGRFVYYFDHLQRDAQI